MKLFPPQNKRRIQVIVTLTLVAFLAWYIWPRRPRIENVVTSDDVADRATIDVLKTPDAVDAIAWHPDSSLLAIQTKSRKNGDYRESAIILAGVKGDQQQVIFETYDPIFAASISPNGNQLACATWDAGPNGESHVLLWNLKSSKRSGALSVAPLEGLGLQFSSDILALAFSPDGRRMAAGTKLVDQGIVAGGHIGGEVCVWDVESQKLKWSDRTTHTDIVYAVHFSPDGRSLASAGYDKLIRLWDAETGELRQTFLGSGWYGAASLSFSPDGQLLATGGVGKEEGGFVRVWDVSSGGLKHTFTRSQTEFQAEAPVRVAFSADGGTLFALGQASDVEWCIKMWHPQSGESKGDLVKRRRMARVLSVAPREQLLAVGAWEGEVVLVTPRK